MKSGWLFCFLLAVLSSGCAEPGPRSPQEIARRNQIQRPSFIERLDLSKKKTHQASLIWAEISEELEPYNQARLALLDEVVSEVREGELNRDELQPLAARTVEAFEGALPAFTTGLNRLHALLNREERQRLVDMVYARTETREEKKSARRDRLARVLDLSAGQKAQLYPTWLRIGLGNLGLLNALKRDAKDAGNRFVSDEFQAERLDLIQKRRPMDLLEFYFEAIKATLPGLTDEQRQSFSAYLDARVR